MKLFSLFTLPLLTAAIEFKDSAIYSSNGIRDNLQCSNDDHCAPGECKNGTCVTDGSCSTDDDCMILQRCLSGTCKNMYGFVTFVNEGDKCIFTRVPADVILRENYDVRRSFPASEQGEPGGFTGALHDITICADGLFCSIITGLCEELGVRINEVADGSNCLVSNNTGLSTCSGEFSFCDLSDTLGRFDPEATIDATQGVCKNTAIKTGESCKWTGTCANSQDFCDADTLTCQVNAGVSDGTFCIYNSDCKSQVNCIRNVCGGVVNTAIDIIVSNSTYGPVGISSGEVVFNVCVGNRYPSNGLCVDVDNVAVKAGSTCNMYEKRCNLGMFCDDDNKCKELANPSSALHAILIADTVLFVLSFVSYIVYNNVEDTPSTVNVKF